MGRGGLTRLRQPSGEEDARRGGCRKIGGVSGWVWGSGPRDSHHHAGEASQPDSDGDDDDDDEQAEIGWVLADAGYLSKDNLALEGPRRLIATGKHRDLMRGETSDGPAPPGAGPIEQMRHTLADPAIRERYKRRGATVEPVNAHLKDGVGLRQFSRRGLPAVTAELNLAATVVTVLSAVWPSPHERWSPAMHDCGVPAASTPQSHQPWPVTTAGLSRTCATYCDATCLPGPS